MKLTILIMTVCLLQVSALTKAQITINAKQESLRKVLEKISQQSGYDFIYSVQDFKNANPVDLKLNNVSIENALSAAFYGQPLIYEVSDKTVMVKKQEEKSYLETVINRFQAIDIRGKVVDSLGNGLAGATVSVKGGKRSISTAANGDFYLKNVEEGAILVVNFLGYVTREVAAGKEFNYIQLQQSTSKLDEVQIQAYGVTSRRLSTGNISSVKAEDIAKQPINNPLLALAGRVPGLEISQASGYSGSAVKVRIQGTNSINPDSNDPFYVIDGVPYPSALLPNNGRIFGNSGKQAGYGYGNPMSYINPQDIESIEVLKDAAATAIYGSRAANGAILVTTKKGKSGQSRVEFNIQSGIGQVPKKLKLLNTQEYLEMRKEAYSNDGIDFISTFPFGSPASQKESRVPDLFLYDQNRFTDWQELLIGNNAKYNDAQFSLSGGSSSVQYLASGNYHKETTVFPGEKDDKKGSAHFNLNTLSPNQKLRFSLGGSYMMDHSNLGNEDLTRLAMTLPPNAPNLYNADGTLNWLANPSNLSVFFINPLSAYTRSYINKTSNLLGNALLSYEVASGLNITSSFGYNKLHTEDIATVPSTLVPPQFEALRERLASYGSSEINSWMVEPQIRYKAAIGASNFEVLLGTSVQQTSNDRRQLEGRQYPNNLVLENINSAQTIVASANSIISKYKYNGIFGRINYNLERKYIIEIVARRDGSSRFGRINQFHNFASASGAWLFGDEKFIQRTLPFLSFGKLRASYGSTGSDQIGDYRFLNLYNNNNPGLPYAGTNGLSPTGLPNEFLQWEETRKLSGGVDLGFLRDRILTSFVLFRNRTSNQLLFYTLPPSTGFSGISSNFPAIVQNSGVEISVNTNNVISNTFTWSTNVNLTIPSNKLVSFPNIAESAYAKELRVGQSINLSPKLFNHLGVDPITGINQFIDKDGKLVEDPSSSPDNQYIRLRNGPLLFCGMQNSIRYKGFGLDFLFQFVKQNGPNYFYGTGRPGTEAENEPITVLARWQKNGDVKPIGKYTATNYAVYGASFLVGNSNSAWQDASYLRLKNLSISWEIPQSWKSKAKIQNARLYLNGQNLYTITEYNGLDPESLSSTSLPPLRVLTFGVQLTF